MSTYHTGLLVYGINLGYSENVLIEQVDEWGTPNLEWMRRDEDGYPADDLLDAISRRLYELMPDAVPEKDDVFSMRDLAKEHYGVWVLEHGWLSEGATPSWILAACDYSVDGGDVLTIDPYELIRKVEKEGLDAKLNKALELLQITPKEPDSRWLLAAER